MHRAYRGPFRVRIEARQRSGWRSKTSGKRNERDRHIGWGIGMERNVEEERAHSKPAGCPAFALRERELPAAARKSELPLSRFPRWGKAGAGGFPPRRRARCASSQKRWHASCAGSPHKRAAAPLCIPCEHCRAGLGNLTDNRTLVRPAAANWRIVYTEYMTLPFPPRR